jgi:hypothetical protein
MRKSVKRAVGAGVVAGGAFAAWRIWKARLPKLDTGIHWESAPFPFPPVARPATEPTRGVAPEPAPAAATWVECNGDGACPATHPVKGKLSSGIYHVPGGQNYARTKPDRCYVDPAAAEADGLRAAKR